MKLESSPLCQLCTQGCLGTFTHMFWECPGVQVFWLQVTKSLSKILNKEVPCCPALCLLNNNSQLQITHQGGMDFLLNYAELCYFMLFCFVFSQLGANI